jgi:sec-independent protein translocase protein TatB
MFDFSMGELMVVMVVALVVIGPERLPKVARTMGHLYGRAQRYVNGVKSDIARDMAIDEYRQLQQKVQAEASSLQDSVQQTAQSVSQQMQQINQVIAEQVQDVQQTPHAEQEHVSSGLDEADSTRLVNDNVTGHPASQQGSLFDAATPAGQAEQMGAQSPVKS